MTQDEAMDLARRYNNHDHTIAKVVRILPSEQDPIVPGDNGWDVEVKWFDPKEKADE